MNIAGGLCMIGVLSGKSWIECNLRNCLPEIFACRLGILQCTLTQRSNNKVAFWSSCPLLRCFTFMRLEITFILESPQGTLQSANTYFTRQPLLDLFLDGYAIGIVVKNAHSKHNYFFKLTELILLHDLYCIINS